MEDNEEHSNMVSKPKIDPMEEGLKYFLNCPNINMVIPWIYEIYKNMAKMNHREAKMSHRGGEESEDDTEKGLQCFLNQPNINMVIPWVYSICRSVKENSDNGHWEDLT